MSNSKQAEYRQNTIGTQFVSCPPEQQVRVYINGQILSAQDFPNSQIFISYKITLPQGWKPEPPQDYAQIELTNQQTKQLNCMQSITQSTLPVKETTPLGNSIWKFYFCFPIDLQLIVKQELIKLEWPSINFQIFSVDFWDRNYMLGCGFVKIPNRQGLHEINIPTWKPKLNLEHQMHEFFLGGIIKPKNIEDISKSSKINQLDQSAPINRMLSKTISSGNIQLRLNVATQTKKTKNYQRVNYKSHKYSQQTQAKKIQKTSNIPSLINTGQVLGSRFTNTKLI